MTDTTKKNLQYRFLSAAFLAPLSLYIIYLGPPYSLILGGCVVICLFTEWFFLCLKNRLPFWRKFFFILVGSFYLILSIFWGLLEIFYKWENVFWLLFLVWSTDTAAYIGGKLLKGPKLVPHISPNKTWAGFFSGMVGGIFVGYITALWLNPDIWNIWRIIPLLVFIAQAGDLLESLAKRWANMKDSGILIPGHGGFLDRLDSFLAVCFSLAVWHLAWNFMFVTNLL